MSDPAQLIVDHLDVWTGAIERKSGSGRGNGGKISLYGIDKLRCLILDLAVRGKLLPQDPADGDAGELLKRVYRERKQLIASKKLSKPKAIRSEESSLATLEAPRSWAHDFFGNVFSLEYGNNLPERARSETGEYPVYGSNGVVGSHSECCVDAPCIVVGRKGSAGAVNRCDEPACWVTDVAFYCVPPVGIELRFVEILFITLKLDDLGKGIKPGLNRNEANALPVALPPLAEQKRIVAKVDELMALVDALEAGTREGMEAHETLVRELLSTLVNSQNADELAENWSRIEANFDILFTTEESIDVLKQTVLELAVRGKFSKSAEANDRGREYDRKQPKPSETPFDIPEHWSWARLSTIGKMKGGGTPAKSIEAFWSGEIPWVSPKDMKRDILDDAALHISQAAIEGSSAKLVAARSIMFVVRGMILAHSFPVGVNSVPVAINQDMKAIELFEPASAEYFLMALKGLKGEMLSKVGRSSHGTCKLESEKYSDFWIPVPPDAEQTKLVRLVAQLDSLCDGVIHKILAQKRHEVLLADALSAQSAA
jgi:type I restriction enzyme S subunit